MCERVIIIVTGKILRDGGANAAIASANQLLSFNKMKS